MALGVLGMRNYRCDLSEISSPRRIDRAGLVAHHIRDDVTTVESRGILVTSPARTLLDCAGVISEQVVARFVETWLSTRVVTMEQIEHEIATTPRAPGVASLMRAFKTRALLKEEPDSPPEFKLGLLLERHGLPLPALHHLVTLESSAVFELDWSYPVDKVAFEMDGYGVHLRSYEAFSNDRDRRNELVLNGWQILNFTTRMLENNPKRVVDQVRRLMERPR